MGTDGKSVGTGESRTARAAMSPALYAQEYQRARPVLSLLAFASVGDRHLAEDLVQEAALTGFRQLDRFEPGTSLLAWLSQIVRNLASNSVRTRARRKTSPAGPEIFESHAKPETECHVPAVLQTGDLSSQQRDFDDDLTRELLGLDSVQRACLLLRIVGELPYDQISVIVGVPEGTAMSHVHRGKRLLRERLTADRTDHKPKEGVTT